MGLGLDKTIPKIEYADTKNGFNAVKNLKDRGLDPSIKCSNGLKFIKQIFNLSSSPTKGEERSAYQELMKMLHPDKVSNDVTNNRLTKMKGGGEGYEVNGDIAAEAFRVASLAHQAFKQFIN